MQDERDSEYRTSAAVNKLYSKVTFNGRQVVKSKPFLAVVNNAKKVGPNDYTLAVDTNLVLEKQQGEYYCWAASCQVLVSAKHNIVVDQEKIVEHFKGEGISLSDPEAAGSVVDIIRALGFGKLTWIHEGGSRTLVESLAVNQPVILLTQSDDLTGHVVVVLGARFSFAEPALFLPISPAKYIFSEFIIFDPATGETEKVNANDVTNSIRGVITYGKRDA